MAGLARRLGGRNRTNAIRFRRIAAAQIARFSATAILHASGGRAQFALREARWSYSVGSSDLRTAVAEPWPARPLARLGRNCRRILSIIQQVQQPSGPYNLLGWSFGGLVAHAMATELQSQGEEVALLALLDSYPVSRETALRERGEAVEKEVIFAGAVDNPLRQTLETLHRDGFLRAALKERDHRAIMDAFEHNARIMRAFVPRRFGGDVLLFVASAGEIKPPIDSWKPYVSGLIRVHPIDCTHDQMMDPLPAKEIGRVLAAELRKQAESRALDEGDDTCRIGSTMKTAPTTY
ncbi:MAG: thioesterase domain-containing protein [Xanthobacteraceae bacterium]